jgi:hypothetical protein
MYEGHVFPPCFLKVKVTIDSRAQGVRRHRCVPNSSRSLDFRKSPIVRDPFDVEVEEAVNLRAQAELLSDIPWRARDLWA